MSFFLNKLKYLIYLFNFLQLCLCIDYCEIENKYCNGLSHVACNINDEYQNSLKDTIRIFDINEKHKYELINKLNIFRNNLASGNIFNETAAKMRLLDWSPELQKLAEYSLLRSPSHGNVFCTATESMRTIEISFLINYYAYNDLKTDDVEDIFSQIVAQFKQHNKDSLPLGAEDTNKIGCAFGKLENESLHIRCVMNSKHNKFNYHKLFKIGLPCSECHSIGTFCDLTFTSLCTNGLSRIRREIQTDLDLLKNYTSTAKDSDDDELKLAGQECESTEDCHFPLVCEMDEDTKKHACFCDEEIYYYDDVAGTCLIDGFDLIHYIKNQFEQYNNTLIICLSVLACFLISCLLTMFVYCRLKISIDRHLSHSRSFVDSKL